MMCEACERGDHEQCGMQTWCRCDCAGPDGVYLSNDWEMEQPMKEISRSYDGPADPCPVCNPNGVPSGHAKPNCLRCAGTFWLPDFGCRVCGEPADGYYQGNPRFPSCGSAKCELKMQGGIDAHEHGTNR